MIVEKRILANEFEILCHLKIYVFFPACGTRLLINGSDSPRWRSEKYILSESSKMTLKFIFSRDKKDFCV